MFFWEGLPSPAPLYFKPIFSLLTLGTNPFVAINSFKKYLLNHPFCVRCCPIVPDPEKEYSDEKTMELTIVWLGWG